MKKERAVLDSGVSRTLGSSFLLGSGRHGSRGGGGGGGDAAAGAFLSLALALPLPLLLETVRWAISSMRSCVKGASLLASLSAETNFFHSSLAEGGWLLLLLTTGGSRRSCISRTFSST